MEVDEEGNSAALTAALAVVVVEAGRDVVGSLALGKGDRGKTRMERASFLALAADP